MRTNCVFGFTLTELLVALIILAEIATFTIPKILNAQRNGSNNARAKETIAMVANAYQQYQLNNTPTSGMSMAALTQYMNYVRVETSGQVDDHVSASTAYNCSTDLCLRLHNGGILFTNGHSFGGTATTNAILCWFDPDGVYGGTGTADGPSKSVAFFVYFNGRITSRAKMTSGTTSADGTHGIITTADPSWFSW